MKNGILEWPKFIKKAIHMWRLRQLIKLMNDYRNPGGADLVSWHSGKIDLEDFKHYLIFKKHFVEPLIFGVHRYFPFWSHKTSERGLAKARRQSEFIEGLFEKAIEREYITPPEEPTQKFVKVTWKGREFIKWLNFIETTAREYNQTTIIIIAVLTSNIFNVAIMYIVKKYT